MPASLAFPQNHHCTTTTKGIWRRIIDTTAASERSWSSCYYGIAFLRVYKEKISSTNVKKPHQFPDGLGETYTPQDSFNLRFRNRINF
jgi:hypothetical protein